MLARHAVLLTPLGPFHQIQLFSCPTINPFAATHMDLFTSVANKRLTPKLNPLAATLTKNRGYIPQTEISLPIHFWILILSFHALTNCKFHNSFLLTFIQSARGSHLSSQKFFSLLAILLVLCFQLLTNCKFHNSFLLTFIQNARGVSPLQHSNLQPANLPTRPRPTVPKETDDYILPPVYIPCAILPFLRSGDCPFLPPRGSP
jgi:hypothetical protein